MQFCVCRAFLHYFRWLWQSKMSICFGCRCPCVLIFMLLKMLVRLRTKHSVIGQIFCSQCSLSTPGFIQIASEVKAGEIWRCFAMSKPCREYNETLFLNPHIYFPLVWTGSTFLFISSIFWQEKVFPNPSDHKASLLVLTANGWLYRLSAETGEELQKVYLSTNVKFKCVDFVIWD